jgi:hypothetical protein
MGGVLSTLVDLAKQNAQGIAKSIEPLARQTAKDLTTAGASQIDKTLIGLENGARTKSMTRGDLDAAMNTTQLGMPIVKKMLPTALKLAAKNNHSSKELSEAANDLIQTSDKFMKE